MVKGYQWLSTFDLHTTKEFCIPRDGRRYTVDKQPVGHSLEWGDGPGRIHWGCRSSFTAILKSWQELGVDANEIDGATRASMDGQIARETNAREFLASRDWTGAELREMFGSRRATRIQSGELSIRAALRQVGVRV